jgi:predicted RNA-binding protein YlxR (DUF448 family)
LTELLAPTELDERDAGPRKAGTERLCAATGAVRPVTEMIRFVVAPDGQVVADLRRRLPGRGIWVTSTRAALGAAIERKAFGRGLRQEVKPGVELIEATERLLETDVLAALSIAHKAGKVAIGFAKVEGALDRGRVVALLHAREAATDGSRKLDARLRPGIGAEAVAVPVLANFTAMQLSLALGRPNVIHAALLAGPESETFLARVGRLDHFRTEGPGDRNRPNRAGKREARDLNG